MSSESLPASAPTVDQTPEELEEKLKKLQIVDVTDAVGANAIDYADAQIAEKTSGKGVGGFLKKIWYGNIGRDLHRQLYINEARKEMVGSGNIYATDDNAQKADHDRAVGAVVERFTSDYIHEGEVNKSFEDVQGGETLVDSLKKLVMDYVTGWTDLEGLIEEKTRLLNEYGKGAHKSDRDKGLIYADNIIEIAEHAKFAAEHGLALDRIDAALGGSVGEARIGVRTEAHLGAVDKALEKTHKLTGGLLVNEAVLGTAYAVAMTVAKVTTRKFAVAAAATILPGIGGGTIAGLRERLRVGQERSLHMRQMAEGQELDDGKRREEMEENRYETVDAAELIDRLASVGELLGSNEQNDFLAAMLVVSETKARIRMSDGKAIDLIRFSGKTLVEQERLDLDIKLAEAKVAVDKKIAELSTEQRTAWGLGEGGVDEAMAGNIDTATDVLETDIDEKDAVFRKLRRKRIAKMALVGAVMGVSLGLTVQESHALFDKGLLGVFESSDGENRRSLLASLFHHGSHNHDASSDLHNREWVGGPDADIYGHSHTAVDLPQGYQFNNNADGRWDLVGPDGKVSAHDLYFDEQGNLSQASREMLTDKGFDLHQSAITYAQPHITTEHVTRTVQEYLRANPHAPGLTQVHRELWYDNNTPGVYDQNELKLWWGGANSTGLDGHGHYVFNVGHMTPDGSFHEGLSTDARTLASEGKMAIALSYSVDTQHSVQMVPIDAHGNALIDMHSPAGQALFENQDGQTKFIGAYAEAVQLMGKSPDGAENIRMLATVVGENHAHTITDTIQHTTYQPHERFVTSINAPAHETPPIEIPPVLPIYSRKGLENLNRPDAEGSYYIGYGDNYVGYVGGREPGRRNRNGLAPYAKELETNPDAKINANKSAERYLADLKSKDKEVINKLSKDLDKQPKTAKPKVVVMIPAASHQEGKNIYNTLSQYSKQTASLDDFEIVVFANRPADTKPDETVPQIERFQKDFPDVRVRLVQRNLSPEEAKIGWVRKTITDAVITDLIKRGIDLNEVLLVSNDADSEWIDDDYLKTIIEKGESSPEVDGFLGFIDWGYDAYRANPELLASTRLMQMIEMYLRKERGQIGSSGANFVFRPGAYTAVGGYRTNSSLGEDVELGRMIKSVRAGAQTRRPIAFLGRSSEVNTSARRALDKLFRDGGAPSEQWNDGFSAYDDLRTRDFDLRDFDFTDAGAVSSLIDKTGDLLNKTLVSYRPSLQDSAYERGRLMFDAETLRNLNRMFSVIGLKVKWMPDGSMRIVNADRMIANLQRWQQQHGGDPHRQLSPRQARSLRLRTAADRLERSGRALNEASSQRLEQLNERLERDRLAREERYRESGRTTADRVLDTVLGP